MTKTVNEINLCLYHQENTSDYCELCVALLRASTAEDTIMEIEKASQPWVYHVPHPSDDPEEDMSPFLCDCGTCDKCAGHPLLDRIRVFLEKYKKENA